MLPMGVTKEEIMTIWTTFSILLMIAGFYTFLSIYMVFHLLGKLFFQRD